MHSYASYVLYTQIHMHTHMHTRTRDETILQYIDILQYLLQQYNTLRLIAIYCNVCRLNVVID